MALRLSISDEVESLVRAMYAAHDLPEAVSILFDTVLEPAGVSGALVLTEEDGELRGVLWKADEKNRKHHLGMQCVPARRPDFMHRRRTRR